MDLEYAFTVEDIGYIHCPEENVVRAYLLKSKELILEIPVSSDWSTDFNAQE